MSDSVKIDGIWLARDEAGPLVMFNAEPELEDDEDSNYWDSKTSDLLWIIEKEWLEDSDYSFIKPLEKMKVELTINLEA